jgi:hypothetical protein
MSIAQKDLNNLLAVSFYGKGSNKFRDFADKEKALSMLKIILYYIPPQAIILLLQDTDTPVKLTLSAATLTATIFIGINQHRNKVDAMQGYNGAQKITEPLTPFFFDANILQQPRNRIEVQNNRELPTLGPSNSMVRDLLNRGFYDLPLPVPDPHQNMTAALKTLSKPAIRNLTLGPLFYGLPLLRDDRVTTEAEFEKYGPVGNLLIAFMQRYLPPNNTDAQALLRLGSMPETDIKSMRAFNDVTNADPKAPYIPQIIAARTILSLAEPRSLKIFTDALNFDENGKDKFLLQLLLMITGLKTASTVVNMALQNNKERKFQLDVEKYSKGVENTNKFIGIICSRIFGVLNKYLNYTTATPEKGDVNISINNINILFIVLKWVATECPDWSIQFANFLDNIYQHNTENKDLPNIYFLSRINELYNDLNTLPQVYEALLESIMSLEKRAVDRTIQADCQQIDCTNLYLYFLRTAVSRNKDVDVTHYLTLLDMRLETILNELKFMKSFKKPTTQIPNLMREIELIHTELDKILTVGEHNLDEPTTEKIKIFRNYIHTSVFY